MRLQATFDAGRRTPFGHEVRRRAFTLIELLVVLGIIALLLALTLPNFRGMNEGRVMEGAARQLLDDLALARQTAIATRSTVALVFIPPGILDQSIIDPFNGSMYNAQERTNILELQSGALTTYGMFSYRQAGEQPGRNTLRYVGSWRTLPDKVFIAEAMYTNAPPDGFWFDKFPFPLASSRSFDLPYIAFNAQGQCLPIKSPVNGATDVSRASDCYIHLAAGAIFYNRDPSSRVVQNWSVQEVPPGNSTSISNVIHIDWLTGRARLERAEIVKQ